VQGEQPLHGDHVVGLVDVVATGMQARAITGAVAAEAPIVFTTTRGHRRTWPATRLGVAAARTPNVDRRDGARRE
jgi:hypothetical protein